MKYWAVGAYYNDDKVDILPRFLAENIWMDGYADVGDDRNKNLLERIQIGDILAVKSSSTKGIGRKTSFTKLKAVGRVVARLDDYKFSMEWMGLEQLPLDFDGISYRKTIELVRDDALLSYLKEVSEQMPVQQLAKLLQQKKQLILQGPPGTGKTRMAGLIAKELTKEKELDGSNTLVDDFFKNYRLTEEIKEQRKRRKELLQQFHNQFPKESLSKMTLEDYCIGRGDFHNFCWWLERGLKDLGRYSPGSSRSYFIYWRKSKEEYSLHRKLLRGMSDPEEAMTKVADYFQALVDDKISPSGYANGLDLKVLSSYYPDEFMPINGNQQIDNALRLFGTDPSGLDMVSKNLELMRIFKQKKEASGKDVDAFEFMRFLFDNFNLKSGENISANNKRIIKGETKTIQFHPSFSYEDFVRGIAATATDNGGVHYEVENRILGEMAEKALENPSANYVLIIDEINRANLSSVLGELIYALEYRGKPVESMYAYQGERELILPKNLLIIGTMNTADRSIGHLDYAIRRRFSFVSMLPQKSVIQRDDASALFEKVDKLFRADKAYLAPDIDADDVRIGHSYFLVASKEELELQLQYEIKPILMEYLKDGILSNKARKKIENLNI